MKTILNEFTKAICLLVLIGFAFNSCEDLSKEEQPEEIEVKKGEDDPFNQVEYVIFEKGKEIKRNIEKLDKSIYVDRKYEKKEEEPKNYDSLATKKLHPLLKRYLEEKEGSETVELVIILRDTLIIPRFPELNLNEDRNSPYNQAVIKTSDAMGDELRRKRLSGQKNTIAEVSEMGIEVVESFWIINGFEAQAQVKHLKQLVELEEVAYIDPVQSEDKPPQNANNNDDVQDGRRLIVSDPYFNLGQTSGYIGLLDTGVDTDHELFTSPNHVDYMYDCVNGGSNCNNTSNANFDPNDDCWDHGTSSAAIVTANNSRGNNHRGVTGITVDNLKVYPNGCIGLHTTASVRAFERAIEIGDRVIIAEMQGSGDHKSSISTAADNAFEAGAVIIAANGNNGPNPKTVNTPANAHKVMGVGNYDVQSQNAIISQSRGPSDDDRIKPDFRCPTNSETADSQGFSSYSAFGGTSGATPYAGGAAALVRNFLRGSSWSIDPGKVYAFLINSSQNPYPFNNDIGAGDLKLPVNGHTWWGKVSISDGATVEIPINIGDPNYTTLDMAIWWPEENFEWHVIIPYWDRHDDIDLRMVSPSGTVEDASVSVPSVFERVRETGNIPTGTWKIRINGYDVKGNQTVYWNVTGKR